MKDNGPSTQNMRELLRSLAEVLQACGEAETSLMIAHAIEGDEAAVREFLVSNELWGGSGSIADQAGFNADREVRKRIELALSKLGREQMRNRIVNVRTKMWVTAFEEWARSGC